MKPLPLWSLSKTPETGAYALSSPSRTTLLLVAKESDGRITYNSREKEVVLSLGFLHVWPLHLHSFSLTFSSFLFALLSFPFSHFSSHPLSSSPHFLPIFSFHLPFSPPFWSTPHIRSKEEISSPFPLTICMAIKFPSLFLISLFPFYDIINHMAQYGPWNSFSHTWLIVSHSFKWTTWLCQVSLS